MISIKGCLYGGVLFRGKVRMSNFACKFFFSSTLLCLHFEFSLWAKTLGAGARSFRVGVHIWQTAVVTLGNTVLAFWE